MTLPVGLPGHEVPAHVPPHLVYRDIWAELAEAGGDAHARAAQLHHEIAPIVWAPQLGYLPGCWVPRRADDMRRILQDPHTFSSVGLSPFAQLLGEQWSLIPLEIDPPDHFKYRNLINPLFAPRRIDQLDHDIRAQAASLVSALAARGHCDFNAEFADQFPTLIFLKLMGWPIEEAPQFVRWTHTLVKSQEMAPVVGAAREIADDLRARIAQCRRTPGDDFTSYALRCEVDGRPLTDDEILGLCFLIFIGGLDTVASSLGFLFMHLARHPAQQAQLRADPALIPQAVEELLRAYSIVNMRRTVTQDVQVGEVLMKTGDKVLIPTQLANLDPAEFNDPGRVDFARDDGQVRHMAFSYGVHRCAGSHLARRELRIAIETWLQQVPPFAMSPDHPVSVRPSGVFGLDNLHLQWPLAA